MNAAGGDQQVAGLGDELFVALIAGLGGTERGLVVAEKGRDFGNLFDREVQSEPGGESQEGVARRARGMTAPGESEGGDRWRHADLPALEQTLAPGIEERLEGQLMERPVGHEYQRSPRRDLVGEGSDQQVPELTSLGLRTRLVQRV